MLTLTMLLFPIQVTSVPPPEMEQYTRSLQTIIVSASGEGDYTSIQDAIDAAHPGDTVFVESGEYTENLVINKTINLIGNSSWYVEINGGGEGDVLVVSADDVYVSGFNFKRSGSDNYYGKNYNSGIELCHVKNVTIENNYLTHTYIGIYLIESHDNLISNNVVKKVVTGVSLTDSNNNIITNSTITGVWDKINLSVLYDNNICSPTPIFLWCINFCRVAERCDFLFIDQFNPFS